MLLRLKHFAHFHNKTWRPLRLAERMNTTGSCRNDPPSVVTLHGFHLKAIWGPVSMTTGLGATSRGTF